MSEVLNIAVIGTGEHARRNTIPALVECSKVKLVGIYDIDDKAMKTVSDEYNVKAFSTTDELLKNKQIDVVYVATPVGLHYHYGLQVLEAGKHLWCEKTFCSSWDEWQTLVAIGQKKSLAVFECFMFIHHYQFQRVLSCIESGELGNIRSLTGKFGFPHLSNDNVRYNKKLGGGMLLDAAGYLVCAARNILDKIESIHSVINTESGYTVDTSGSALLQSESGQTATLDWGFGRAYRNEIEIWCERGTLYVERAFSKPPTLETKLRLVMQNGETNIEIIEPCNHFVLMFNAFADSITNRTVERFNNETINQGHLMKELFAVNEI